MNTWYQMSIFEDDETVTIVCEYCGAVFIFLPASAENFKEVHGCYQDKEVNEK